MSLNTWYWEREQVVQRWFADIVLFFSPMEEDINAEVDEVGSLMHKHGIISSYD